MSSLFKYNIYDELNVIFKYLTIFEILEFVKSNIHPVPIKYISNYILNNNKLTKLKNISAKEYLGYVLKCPYKYRNLSKIPNNISKKIWMIQINREMKTNIWNSLDYVIFYTHKKYKNYATFNDLYNINQNHLEKTFKFFVYKILYKNKINFNVSTEDDYDCNNNLYDSNNNPENDLLYSEFCPKFISNYMNMKSLYKPTKKDILKSALHVVLFTFFKNNYGTIFEQCNTNNRIITTISYNKWINRLETNLLFTVIGIICEL
jgi:hypothetical protein